MTAHRLTDCSKLCVHTITTKPWPIELAMDKYAEAGLGGITVWRQALEGRSIDPDTFLAYIDEKFELKRVNK